MARKKFNSDEERKQAARDRQKKYYNNNKEMLYLKSREYVKNNRDKMNEWRRKDYWSNPERARNYQKVFYEKNRDSLNKIARIWKSKNKHIVNLHTAKRRAKLNPHPSASTRAMEQFYIDSRSLTLRTGVLHEVDHIIPLSRNGFHHESNLQVLTRKCNGSSGKGKNPFWISPSPEIKDWRDVPRELWPENLASIYEGLIAENKGKSLRWDVAS